MKLPAKLKEAFPPQYTNVTPHDITKLITLQSFNQFAYRSTGHLQLSFVDLLDIIGSAIIPYTKFFEGVHDSRQYRCAGHTDV